MMYDIIVLENLRFRPSSLACEQVLQRALAAETEKGRRACNYYSGIGISPPIPLWLPVD